MRIALFNHPLSAMGGGARYTLALAQALASKHHVTVLHDGGIDAPALSHRFNLSLSEAGVALRTVVVNSSLQHVSQASRDYDLFINCSYAFPQPLSKHSALVCFFPAGVDLTVGGNVRRFIGNSMRPMRAMLPTSLGQRLNGLPTNDSVRALRAYSQIIGISDYTRHWIRHYWQRESDLLYPLVAAIQPASTKINEIVHVGRFYSNAGHTKKHEVMIRAFREMCDAGITSVRGWTLRLIGGLSDTPEQQAYFNKLQREAHGYPIELQPNVQWSQLARHVGEAALYWHASGFEEDLRARPIRAEHFGITTVEAMSAGCAPVVINLGGQPEIVRDGLDGYVWNTLDELKTKTFELIEAPERRATFSQAAIARSQYFCDAERFRQMAISLFEI